MLIGRGEETAAVDRLLESARSGRSGVLVVRGEAGIGKTALLEHALGRASGFAVLRAVGIESESELSYAALHQLVRPVLDRIERLPEPQAAALRAAFALSEETVEERFRVSVGVLGLLAEAAEDEPLLCIVDDAQWLDDASADALAFAARRLYAERLALLFAVRDGDARAFAATGLPELRLGSLAPLDARALVAARLGAKVPPEILEWLLERSNGNPLALVELPAALDSDHLDGRVPLSDTVAAVTSVEETYLARIAELPPSVRHLLLIAAAEETGNRSIVSRAAAELRLDPDELALAERVGLVRVHPDRIEFGHPLMRSATYRGAGFAEREHVHRALATVLSSEGEADRRAWHRAAAAHGPDEEIARELEASAERAIQRAGYPAAAAALERAARLTEDERARTLRLLAAADATWLAGRTDRALALLADASRHGPADLQVEVTKLRGRIEVRTGVFADAMAMLLSAARELSDSDPATALQLLLEAEEATLYTGDTDAIVEIGALAQQLAADHPESVDRAGADALIGIGLLLAGDYDRAAPLLQEAVARGATSEDIDVILHSTRVASVLGDDPACVELCNRALRVARELGAIGALPRILERFPFYELRLGHYASARMHAVEGLGLARELGQEPGTYLCELAFISAVEGREEECRAYVAEAIERAEERRSGLFASLAAWALGLLELGLGRYDEAIEALGSVLPGEDVLTHRIIALFLLPDYVEACARAGRLEHARAALVPYEEWARVMGQPWVLALVAHCHGLVSTGDAAEEHFTAALELHPQSIRPFGRARTELALGEVLRRGRRRNEAREHLRSALLAFERLGATQWEERARNELRATGEATRKRDPSTQAELTPQELQIARLVADGGSNKEIAAQLFLSPRTVEYHLRKVFAKLGIASRAELVRDGLAEMAVA